MVSRLNVAKNSLVRNNIQAGDYIDERLAQFQSIYACFFDYHLLPFLQLKEDDLKKSSIYEICRKIINEDKNLLQEIHLNCKPMIGLNLPLINWMISAYRFLLSKIELSKKNESTNPDEESKETSLKDVFVQLSDLLNNTPAPFDDHTLVIFSWYLPQTIEVFALTKCLISTRDGSAVSKRVNDTDVRRVAELLSCFQEFKENTVMAVYLLTGDYMFNRKFFAVANSGPVIDTSVLQLLVLQLQEKNTYNTESLRKLQKSIRKTHTPVSSVPSRSRAPLTTYELLQEQLLLEPRYRIMMALCQLVLVNHEDEETTRLLLRYCGAQNILVNLIKRAIHTEVEQTQSFEVLFREESVATKLMSSLFFSSWGGSMYLHRVVQPLINSVSKSVLATEDIDLSSSTHVDLIRKFTENFLKRIYKSTHLFPLNIRVILAHAQKLVGTRFPEMRQRVVGSFLFLRFVVPALVTPERYRLKGDFSLSHKKAIICISRVLQTIANGALFDESKGDYVQLNDLIEAHLSRLHEYFDCLADLSDVSFSYSDFKFQVEPTVVYTDFSEICGFLRDLSHEMKQLLKTKHSGDTMCLYLNFLTLSNPSIFHHLTKESDAYSKVVQEYLDLLPSSAVKHLLGISRTVGDTAPVVFSWHKKFCNAQDSAKSLTAQCSTAENTLGAYHSVIQLHEFASVMYAKWATYPRVLRDRQQISTRKAFILLHLFRNTKEAHTVFLVPELMEVWNLYLDSVEMLVNVLLVDVLSNFTQTNLAKESLSRIIVATRWIITQLTKIQGQYWSL